VLNSLTSGVESGVPCCTYSYFWLSTRWQFGALHHLHSNSPTSFGTIGSDLGVSTLRPRPQTTSPVAARSFVRKFIRVSPIRTCVTICSYQFQFPSLRAQLVCDSAFPLPAATTSTRTDRPIVPSYPPSRPLTLAHAHAVASRGAPLEVDWIAGPRLTLSSGPHTSPRVCPLVEPPTVPRKSPPSTKTSCLTAWLVRGDV
jgi:hypothetical protein